MNTATVYFPTGFHNAIENQLVDDNFDIQEMSFKVTEGEDWNKYSEDHKMDIISKFIAKNLSDKLPKGVKVVRSTSRAHSLGNRKRLLTGMMDYTLESETSGAKAELSASLVIRH